MPDVIRHPATGEPIALGRDEQLHRLALQEDRGTEAAFEVLANSEDAEEFARLWDEAQQDLANGAVASVDNLVDFVSSARDGFNDNPRHLLVLLQREGNVSAYHVPADALK